ncbi:MAG: hypothetical protein KatS3mg059_0730 [Thermomicrobiales bacterium]|nr:MAG: hypothetical protein KatS3mg059_0730 [Thermomicrobiales bacterium]
MTPIRIVARGLSDTLESLLPYTLASLLWWPCLLSIIAAPGATLALFRFTDPRSIAASYERPGLRDSITYGVRGLGRAWKLTLLIGVVGGVLVYNLRFYGSHGGRLAVLGPLWLVLLGIWALIGLSAWACAALFELPALPAIRQAAMATLAFLPRGAVVGFLLLILLAVSGLLVVPLVMFMPATVAAISNRLLLANLQIPIPDSLAPTEERRVEEAQRRAARRFGP